MKYLVPFALWCACAALAQETRPYADAQGVEGVVESLLEQGDGQRALEQALLLVEKQPSSARAQLLLGRAYLLHADDVAGGSALSRSVEELLRRDAETACAKAISLGSKDPLAFALLAQLLARRGDSEQALRILDRGLTDAGPSADLLVLQSSLLSKKGDHEQSLASARKAVEIAPQSFDALLALTAALERSGAGAQAIEAASNLAKTFPERDDLCLLLWELHGGQGNFERAVAYYKALSTVAPSSPSVWMYLGAAERRAGQLDAAERDLLKAAEMAPGSLDPQNELASLRQVQGKLDEAAKLFARVAREENPLKEQAFERVQVLAGMLARNLKFDAAIELFEELRRIDPKNYDATANRALALRQAGRVAESETAYREALAMFPGDRVLTNDLGLLLLGIGRREEARTMLEEAEKLGSLDAAENLAVLDLQRGDARSAEARLEHVLSSDRTRARAMVALETARQRR